MSLPFYRALGLMSGTSLDGIDAALIETDGQDHVRPLGGMDLPYDLSFRNSLRPLLGHKKGSADPLVKPIEEELTRRHASLVEAIIRKTGGLPDLIGFHGQTLYHAPTEGLTIQIGDGALLARLTGIPVVNDFRRLDIKAGGQGAPLVPLYHRALAATLPKPALILNIGGVANVTWIGATGELSAFDVGPGNALIDDWMLRHTGQGFDGSGALAAQGTPDHPWIKTFLAHAFFSQKPPKSLDRDVFALAVPHHLTAADGAATLTLMTAQGIAQALRHVPRLPERLFVTGGGRRNDTLMHWIAEVTALPTEPVEKLNWNGDMLEAEAFAWLAVRSVHGLPLSLPETTGVQYPTTGGSLHRAHEEITASV